MRVVVVSDRRLSSLALVIALRQVPEVSVVAEVERFDEARKYCENDEADAVLADATAMQDSTADEAASSAEPAGDNAMAMLVTGEWDPWQVPPSRITNLSAREMEVFSLLGRGLSNRRIGRALGLSERTVKTHVGRVLAKLQVESRLEAGLTAFVHYGAERRFLTRSRAPGR